MQKLKRYRQKLNTMDQEKAGLIVEVNEGKHAGKKLTLLYKDQEKQFTALDKYVAVIDGVKTIIHKDKMKLIGYQN